MNSSVFSLADSSLQNCPLFWLLICFPVQLLASLPIWTCVLNPYFILSVPEKLHAPGNCRAPANRTELPTSTDLYITCCLILKEAFLHSWPVSDGDVLLPHGIQQCGNAVKCLSHIHKGEGRAGSLQACHQFLDVTDTIREKHHCCDDGPHFLRLGTRRKTEQKALSF